MDEQVRPLESDEVPGADLPDWSEAFGWADPDEPWVEVARGWGWHKEVEIRLALLLDAGIPAGLHDCPR